MLNITITLTATGVNARGGLDLTPEDLKSLRRLLRQSRRRKGLPNAADSAEPGGAVAFGVPDFGERLGKRAYAQRVRALYLQHFALSLRQAEGGGDVAYQTPEGRSVAIPFAREAEGWWLGVRCEMLDADVPAAVILLCQTAGRQLLDFVLEPEFIRTCRQQLSSNTDGYQYKFNVRRRQGNHFVVLAPHGNGEIDITDTLSRRDSL